MPTEDDVGSDERDTRDMRSVRRRLERVVPDLVRRTVSAGLGAVMNTEEGIRKLANEFSLPKDVVAYLLSTAQSSKDELFRIFAREVRGFLENVNLSQELAKVLTMLSFEVKLEARFIPNDEAVGGVKADVKKKVAIKKTKED